MSFSLKDIRNYYNITGINIDIYSLGLSVGSRYNVLEFNFSGAQIKNIQIENKLDNITRINVQGTKYI